MLIERAPEVFREKQDIDVRIRHEVMELDLANKRVRVERLETGKSSWEPFDQLLIAMGASPLCPSVPGSDASGIYGVNTLGSGIRILRAVEQKRPKRAVIVGGGYIGLEMAEALVRQGLSVSLVDRSSQVMKTLDPDMGVLVSEALRRIGVELFLEQSLQAFEVSGGKVSAVVTEKQCLPTDLVILGMGVRPNSELADKAGIPLGEKGSIRVNDRMQTDVENVWAAGDCAQTFHLVSRRPFFMPLGTVANKQGRVAGINLGGGNAVFPGVVGTAASKICDWEIARTGLMEKEIKDLGIEYVSSIIESRTHAGYYPNSGPITVKLIAEKGSGRLLGGQIVGAEGSAKRIDIVAICLHAGFSVDQMIDLDLSYAPPFSIPWDPVVIAARDLTKVL